MERLSPRHLLVGGFTRPARHGHAQGVTLLRLADGGARTVATLALDDPSYFAQHPRLARRVYVSHSDAGYISAVQVDAEDETPPALRLAGRQATGGENAAHLACAPDGSAVIVASFGSGHVSALPLDEQGIPQPAACILRLQSPLGPRRAQSGNQPHQVLFSPDGRHVLAPDRGADAVWILAFDPATASLRVTDRCAQRPGAGCRHLAWHPRLPLAYLVNELDSSLAILAWQPEHATLRSIAVHPLLPPSFFGANISAAVCVSPDGRHVYASNRGQDAIAIVTLSDDGCGVAHTAWQAGTGASPRFMSLHDDGRLLLVASHGADAIHAYRRDPLTGGLHRLDAIASPSPACLLPV